MRTTLVTFSVLLVLISSSASAGVQILSTETMLHKPDGPGAISSMREEVLAAQSKEIIRRMPAQRAARAAEIDLMPAADSRGGSIIGTISVSPAPEGDTYFEGTLLALDRHGYVAAETYWSQDYESDFELWDVPVGDYYVFFLSEGWDYDAHLGSVVNQFYNNTTDWEQASMVTVTEGGTASGIDFDLQSNSGYVSITVLDGNGQPLADTDVLVELYSCSPADYDYFGEHNILHFYPMTDASGTAIVGPVPLGGFYMSARAQNFGTLYYPDTPDPTEAQSLELTTVGQTITGITFNLPVGGSIAGNVTLDTGDPGFGVFVNVFPAGGDSSIADAMVMDFTTGAYTVEGVPPGDYVVMADPSFVYPDYTQEYWNDKPTAETADIVTVQANQTTDAIDFVLEPGGSISGTISSDYPEAYENTFFMLFVYPADDSTKTVTFTFADGAGDYTIGGLRPGSYKVSLQGMPYPMWPVYYDDAGSFDEAAEITVSGTSETTGIDFYLEALGRVTGTVSVAGSNPPLDEAIDFVIAYPETIPLNGDPSLWFLWPAMVEDDGSYFIGGLPTGDYKIWVSTQWPDYEQPGYASEYYGGSYNFFDAVTVHVTEGQTTTGIDVEIDPEAVVEGYVSLPGGAPAGDEDVEVLVIAYDAQTGYPVGIGLSDEAPVYDEDNNTFCAGYRIRQLPGENIKIAAVPYGAQAAVGYYGGGSTFDAGGALQLTAGQTYPQDADISLSTGTATISGMVTRDDTGEPLNWVAVSSYDPTGHLTGWSRSGFNPSTDQAWQDGKYEIQSLVNGSSQYLRTWSILAWMMYTDLNPGAEILPADEWYDDLQADMLPLEMGMWMPFGYYYYLGVMPFLTEVPNGATAVAAPATGIDFALGFSGQGSHDLPSELPRGVTLDQIWPNPSTSELSLELSINSTQRVRVELIDLAGRMLGVVDLGEMVEGKSRTLLNLNDLRSDLPSGVYTLRVVGENAQSSKEIVILK